MWGKQVQGSSASRFGTLLAPFAPPLIAKQLKFGFSCSYEEWQHTISSTGVAVHDLSLLQPNYSFKNEYMFIDQICDPQGCITRKRTICLGLMIRHEIFICVLFSFLGAGHIPPTWFLAHLKWEVAMR